ncbi:hypothetical protein OH784_12330 [Ectobacillus funiculus]|uniref:hypothetical protein n=1 Tax=Ectobacillus funiculus TaxID=137993 RepID=UPI00397B6D44
MEEQKQYAEYLLEWCNHIYFYWKSMKPRFSRLFDLKTVDEWEELCYELKEKLQKELRADSVDFQIANSLYEQWELLYRESQAYLETI